MKSGTTEILALLVFRTGVVNYIFTHMLQQFKIYIVQFSLWPWKQTPGFAFQLLSFSVRKRAKSVLLVAACLLEEERDMLFSRFRLAVLTPRSKCANLCLRKRENSPSNKQRSKCLHPGNRWCRNTGSSENKCCSVSTYSLPRACSFLFPWPQLLLSITEQNKNPQYVPKKCLFYYYYFFEPSWI